MPKKAINLDPAQASFADDVAATLPKDKVLRQFAKEFVEAMSLSTRQSLVTIGPEKFLKERYQYFKQAVKAGGGFQVIHSRGHASMRKSKYILELAYPDARHLLFTLESLCHEFEFNVTCKLHPIFAVGQSKAKQVVRVSKAAEKEDLFSVVYIEFDDIIPQKQLVAFKKRVGMHMLAVQHYYGAQKQLADKLNELKTQVKLIRFPSQSLKKEWQALLEWLDEENFIFEGYVAYHWSATKPKPVVKKTSNLGILSPDYLAQDQFHLIDVLGQHVEKYKDAKLPIQFDRISAPSPVQRFDPIMRLCIQIKDGKKWVSHNFLGFLRRSSLNTRNLDTPLIRLKMEAIFESGQMWAGSHDYNEVIRLMAPIPKFELFRLGENCLIDMVHNLLSINNPADIYCFSPMEVKLDYLPLMVVMPRNLFSKANIQAVVDYMQELSPGTQFEIVEVFSAEKCRLHIHFDVLDFKYWPLNLERIQNELREKIRPWEARLRDLLFRRYQGTMADQLYRRYVPGMPPHYRVRTTPADAERDIGYLERVAKEGRIQYHLTRFTAKSLYAGKVSLLTVYSGNKIDLIEIMPILENMGVHVLDQLTARIGPADKVLGYVQSFRIGSPGGEALQEHRYERLLGEILVHVFHGQTENDGLNKLALLAELGWREINIFQAYRNLYLQLSTPYSKEKINQVLCRHPDCTRKCFSFFEAKFSVDSKMGPRDYRESVLLPKLKRDFIESLRSVEDVSEDLILRHIFNLIENTLRTNFYQFNGDRTAIALKIDSASVNQMPKPSPYREIYVHDIGLEGTHLRFGRIARGGLRWSTRLDDFRNEVLDLVATQHVKNVVIVPDGAKGGFVVKKQKIGDRVTQEDVEEQYKKFISALLDITDNMSSSGEIIHPECMTIYDDPDPYLVVAADKGTATFSDLANKISKQRRFWLGDAFASGGSFGFDHKKVGITARGAWESVKLHFKELGQDVTRDAISVAGIGDMSGDVFGNGMLLSDKIKLVAAFNHLHIFIDPDPDPKKSWKERTRLFRLTRSSWTDYSPDAISSGGGIFDRRAKEIHLTPEIQSLLNVTALVMTGEELVHHVLKMQVDLLWFGGIGTYIKGKDESHRDVGDPANDSVRISSNECGARVVAEGANLGITQRGRIELALQHVALNKDAIDNSAGVNLSDFEVNIKIVLGQFRQEGRLKSMAERNKLLLGTTQAVTELALLNNRTQHRLISMDQIRSKELVWEFRSLIEQLADKGYITDRSLVETELLVNKAEHVHAMLPRPVIASLQAYLKMMICRELARSELVTDPFCEQFYRQYFPKQVAKKFGAVTHHQLKNEIIALVITNLIVNHAGATYFSRVSRHTGATVGQIAQAYLLAAAIFDAQKFWDAILAESTPEPEKYRVLIEFEDRLQAFSEGLIRLSGNRLSFKDMRRFKTLFDQYQTKIVFAKRDYQSHKERYIRRGHSPELSAVFAMNPYYTQAGDVIYIHEKESIPLQVADKILHQIDRVFGLQWLARQIMHLRPVNSWEHAQQGLLLKSLHMQKLALARFLIEQAGGPIERSTDEELLLPFESGLSGELASYLSTLNQLKSGVTLSMTSLSVCMSRLNLLVVG